MAFQVPVALGKRNWIALTSERTETCEGGWYQEPEATQSPATQSRAAPQLRSLFLEKVLWNHPVHAHGAVHELRDAEVHGNAGEHVGFVGALP